MWVGILVLTSGVLYVTIVHRTRRKGKSCRRLFSAGEMVKLSYSDVSKFCLRGYCERFPVLRILDHILYHWLSTHVTFFCQVSRSRGKTKTSLDVLSKQMLPLP